EVLGPDKKPVRGIGTGEFPIPTDIAGGEYILEVKEGMNRFPPERRKFVINRYQKHRLNKEINLDKESFGPGSEVVANAKVEMAEGGFALAHVPVNAVVRIDGAAYKANGEKAQNEAEAMIHLKTDEYGKAQIKFTLPKEIERGDASLSVSFSDGGANFEPLS